ncbi:unnamed protein product, partial [Owenia fusiformis]
GGLNIFNIAKKFSNARSSSFYSDISSLLTLTSRGTHVTFERASNYRISEKFFELHNPQFSGELGGYLSFEKIKDRQIYVEDKLVSVGNSSICLASSIIHNGEAIATFESQVVHVDWNSRKAVPLPVWFTEKYREFMKISKIKFTTNMNKPNSSYSYSIKVSASDLDMNNHVNMAIYLRYCLDAGYMACKDGAYEGFEGDLLTYKVQKSSCLFFGESVLEALLSVYTWEDSTQKNLIHFQIENSDEKLVYFCSMWFH